MAKKLEIKTADGVITVSNNVILDPSGKTIGKIYDEGLIKAANGGLYRLYNGGIIADEKTGEKVAQLTKNGSLHLYKDLGGLTEKPQPAQAAEEDADASEGSALTAVSAVLAWILSVVLVNVVFLAFAALCLFLGILAGSAFPRVGSFLRQTEVVPELETRLNEYLPGFLTRFQEPGVARVILIAAAALLAACVVLTVIGCFRVFRKADVNPVFVFIPLANLYQICAISGGGFLLFLCMLIPGVQLFAVVALDIGLARAFGRSALFAVPLILCPPLFMNLLPFRRDYIE